MSGGWTKGPWSAVWHQGSHLWSVRSRNGKLVFNGRSVTHRTCGDLADAAKADAALIAEAGTVANETGLSPRQLADQRAELLAALIGLLDANDSFAKEANWGASALSAETIAKVNEAPGIARAAIAKATCAS